MFIAPSSWQPPGGAESTPRGGRILRRDWGSGKSNNDNRELKSEMRRLGMCPRAGLWASARKASLAYMCCSREKMRRTRFKSRESLAYFHLIRG